MNWLKARKQESQKQEISQGEDMQKNVEQTTSTAERAISLEETLTRVGPGVETHLTDMGRELGMEWARIDSVKAYVGSERLYFLDPSSSLLRSGSSSSGRYAGYVWQVKHPSGLVFFLVLALCDESTPFFLALNDLGRSLARTAGPEAVSETELQKMLTIAAKYIKSRLG